VYSADLGPIRVTCREACSSSKTSTTVSPLPAAVAEAAALNDPILGPVTEVKRHATVTSP
jgi:hypothetical protein